jgi:hypothetical protein
MRRFSIAFVGYPTCHVACAQNYWMVIYDVGSDLETSFKMGLQ